MKAGFFLSMALSLAAVRADEPAPRGSMLLLHYQWKHDTLSLVESKRVPAFTKVRRSSRAPAAPKPSWVDADAHGAFSYELLGANGNPITTRFLQDPAVQRVEYQAPGDATLRSEERKLDSADVFLRIPDPDARVIRFYRHTPAIGPVVPLGKASAQGPSTPAMKSLLAEFPLEAP
jgi:hypothetical protein